MPHRGFYESLTIAGIVSEIDPKGLTFSVRSRSDDLFEVRVGGTTYYQVLNNLDGLNRDRAVPPSGLSRDENPLEYDLLKYVNLGCLTFIEGIYAQDGTNNRFEARTVYLMHSNPGKYLF